ncbi:MAG: tetratricopeptide repeat protein [Anaerolineae bacterium]
MSANVEGMVREGIAAFKEGRKEEARALLSKAVELDQYNEQGWMWLSGCVDAPDDQRICLENVLAINPMNERARKGLAYLEGQNVDFNKPKPAPPPPPSSVHDMPTSVEWDTPGDAGAGSAAAFTPASTPISDEEYDNWVTGLNLPTGVSSTPAPPPSPATLDDVPGGPTPFTDINFDDDLFANGPFKADDLSAPAAPADPGFSGTAGLAKSEPPKKRGFEFGRAAVLSPGDSAAAKPEKPKRQTREEKQAAKEEKRAAARAEKEKRRTEEISFDSGPMEDMFMPEPIERDYSLSNDLDADHDGQMLEEGEGELFGVIPDEIKITRLPGTREGYPLIGLLLLIALIVLNVGAIGVLVVQVMNSL